MLKEIKFRKIDFSLNLVGYLIFTFLHLFYVVKVSSISNVGLSHLAMGPRNLVAAQSGSATKPPEKLAHRYTHLQYYTMIQDHDETPDLSP